MYWIGPGRYTAERNRAFAIYATVGIAFVGVAVGLSVVNTGGLTVEGLTGALSMMGLIAAFAGYSFYSRSARAKAAARQAGVPQGVVTGPNVVHAVYTPVAPPAGYAAQPPYPVVPGYPQYPMAPTAYVPAPGYPMPPGAYPMHPGYAAVPVVIQPMPMTPQPPPPGAAEHTVIDHEPLPPSPQ